MKFRTVDPLRRMVNLVDAADLRAACGMVGLPHDEVDHGVLGVDSEVRIRHEGDAVVVEDTPKAFGQAGVGIVVWDNSLYAGPAYWAVGKQLYNGPGVMYGFDAAGNGDDVTAHEEPRVRFLGTVTAVRDAITAGEVEQPVASMGNAVLWAWTGEATHKGPWE